MKTKLFLTTIITIQTTVASTIMIDLDLTTAGVQSSIIDAEEGDIVEFALVVTDFIGSIHCFNGIGGDISSKGTMDVNFSSDVIAGSISQFTNENMASDVVTNTPVSLGSTLQNLGLAPLVTYTDNVGGGGYLDPPNNRDANNHVISFVNVPGGSASYATIFTGSMTLTNVSGNTLNLFPSGVFNNPATIQDPDGNVALQTGGMPAYEQDGDLMLHTEPHDFDQCVGLGAGNYVGATITGISVPEPTSIFLLGLGGLGLIMRRKRVF